MNKKRHTVNLTGYRLADVYVLLGLQPDRVEICFGSDVCGGPAFWRFFCA